MLLVADVGNTETTLGLCKGEIVTDHWRVTTDAARTPDEVFLLLRNLLAASDVAPSQLTGSAIGSVVPSVTGPLAEAFARVIGVKPVIVDARSPLGITLAVDEPMTVGADRIQTFQDTLKAGGTRSTASWSISAPPRPTIASPPTGCSSAV